MDTDILPMTATEAAAGHAKIMDAMVAADARFREALLAPLVARTMEILTPRQRSDYLAINREFS